MKRRWDNIFGSDSDDDTIPLDSLVFKSSSPEIYPDIDLSDLIKPDRQRNVFPIGRKDVGSSKYIKYISGHHCDVLCDDIGNITLTSCCRFDVMFVNDILLSQGKTVPIVHNDKIRLCKNTFEYTLVKVKKKSRRPERSLSESESPELTAGSGCWEDLAMAREWADMAAADVESNVFGRKYTVFKSTVQLCRTLLSSFHCDICLELIASCRSCVPCGHSFCGPCIQGYISSVR
jgi:hypothetical protein